VNLQLKPDEKFKNAGNKSASVARTFVSAFLLCFATTSHSSEGLLHFALYTADADMFNQVAVDRCKEGGMVSSKKLDEALAKWRSLNKLSADKISSEFIESLDKQQAEQLRAIKPKHTRELLDKLVLEEKTPGGWCKNFVDALGSNEKDPALVIIENEQRKAVKK
jgi:hypothetical protein